MAKKSKGGVVGGEARTAAVGKRSRVAAATTMAASGAPNQVTDFDVKHPAIDIDPRANTTAEQNRIDMNDPTLSSAEAVEKNLAR